MELQSRKAQTNNNIFDSCLQNISGTLLKVRNGAIIRCSVLLETPKIIYNQAKDISHTLHTYSDSNYIDPLKINLNKAILLPKVAVDRVLETMLLKDSNDQGPKAILRAHPHKIIPNRIYLNVKSDLNIPHQSAVLADFIKGEEEVSMDGRFPEKLAISHEEFPNNSYDRRSSKPLVPRKSWSLPFSLAVSGIRAVLSNDISLNTARFMSNLQYHSLPKSVEILEIPQDYTEIYKMFGKNGLEPIVRLGDEVCPDGFAADDTQFKLSNVERSLKPGELSQLRFFVASNNDESDDFISGEWLSTSDVREAHRQEMISTFGPRFVRAAEKLSEQIKLAERKNIRWLQEWEKTWQPYYAHDSSEDSFFGRFILANQKKDLISAYNSYITAFESLPHDIKLNMRKRLSDQKVVLYLHGGGYSLMSAKTHRSMVWKISRETGCRILSINYRLTPEHSFPAALIDATSAYLHLIDPTKRMGRVDILASSGSSFLLDPNLPHPNCVTGESPVFCYKPENVFIMGDSAGGGLSLALALHIRELQLPKPGGLVLISPWVDLTCSMPSWNRNHSHDYLPRQDVRKKDNVMSAYTAWNDSLLTHPLVSPIFADISWGLPNILVQVGEVEYLIDENIFLAQKLLLSQEHQNNDRTSRNLTNMRLEVYQDMVHVWHFFKNLKLSDFAFHRIGYFIKNSCQKSDENSGRAEKASMREDSEIIWKDSSNLKPTPKTTLEKLYINECAEVHEWNQPITIKNDSIFNQ